MKEETNILTILGSAGGVAKSILSILNAAACDVFDPIHHSINHSMIYLLDIKQKDESYYQKLLPHLFDKLVILEIDLKDSSQFSQHLIASQTQIVLDVSWADTVEMLDCCNKLGVHYINTALENTMIDEHEDDYEGFPLIERIRIFEKNKPTYSNMTGIVCSGMNPGVVQWMALELMKMHPKEIPLACYIVEDDNSFFQDKSLAKKNEIYTTWSPECFLDEAIMSYPMFMQNHTPIFLHEDVYALDFKVTLGPKVFYGCLMPHEEVYTLCQLFDFESGFIYKVNDHTTDVIRENLGNVDDIWKFNLKVLNPAESPLDGEDLIGVLLVFKDKEVYMYNTLSNKAIFDQYQTNATYFQVACGLYSALATLLLDQLPKGVFYVDELLLNTDSKYGHYLKFYMKDFIMGENDKTDGLLLKRMKRFKS
jgi:homospermidine synthase